MKNYVKALALVLALVFAMGSLCACGAKTDKPADTAVTDTAEKTPAVKVIDIELTQEDYAFGVDKAQPELLEQVNAFIAKIQSDGTFDEICNHYFGDGEPVMVTSAKKDASKDQLVVATAAGFEPFEYTSGDYFTGIDMEIAQLFANELGKELVIDNMEFDAVCLSVGQHKCDIAMAGLTVKPERLEFVTFSDSYYKAAQKIITKGDDTTFDACQTAEDVVAVLQGFDANTKIGYQNGTTGKMYVSNESDYASNNFKITGMGYKNGSLAVQDLYNGNIRYVVIDSAPADCIVKAINEVLA